MALHKMGNRKSFPHRQHDTGLFTQPRSDPAVQRGPAAAHHDAVVHEVGNGQERLFVGHNCRARLCIKSRRSLPKDFAIAQDPKPTSHIGPEFGDYGASPETM